MYSIGQQVKIKLLSREKVITKVRKMVGNSEDTFPASVYINGLSGTGKSAIVEKLFAEEFSNTKSVVLNCVECYTSRLLFEKVIQEFMAAENNVQCETLKDFVSQMSLMNAKLSYILYLDTAERLRAMEANIISTFMRLPELTGLNICCVFISQLPFEKYFVKTGLLEVIQITCPQYNKTEVLTILLQDLTSVKESLLMQLETESHLHQFEVVEKNREIIKTLKYEFYSNYLNLFLGVFFKVCREITELRIMSKKCFLLYIQPVLNKSVQLDDVSCLWRNIINPLRIALNQVYRRTEDYAQFTFYDDHSYRNIALSSELPYYTKYLLISAFLASHNPVKQDKILFVKNHGKRKKRMHTANEKTKREGKMSTSLGPKSFSIDRLLAIFYAILEEKIELTSSLLSQISTLVHLKLLNFVSGENNVMEGIARLQCAVGLESIIVVGQGVDFNVGQYLREFK